MQTKSEPMSDNIPPIGMDRNVLKDLVSYKMP